MNVKISGAIVTGLTLLAGAGGYIESSNDITINETVEFDSQEEFEAKKTELTDLYFANRILKIGDAKDLGAMIKYSKGEDFLRIKNHLRGKDGMDLFDRQLFIAVLNAQKELRQESIILIEPTTEGLKSELDTYLEDL